MAAGANPKEVATRAAHASMSFTLDRYGHLLPGSEQRLNDAFDALAEGAQATAEVTHDADEASDSGEKRFRSRTSRAHRTAMTRASATRKPLTRTKRMERDRPATQKGPKPPRDGAKRAHREREGTRRGAGGRHDRMSALSLAIRDNWSKYPHRGIHRRPDGWRFETE